MTGANPQEPPFEIDTALVLAAGKGTRMRAHTAKRPKPLVEVAGISLIDRVLDHLADAGVCKAVVNLHHMADMLESHLKHYPSPPQIVFSDERDELLDTGGGAVRALHLLGEKPVFVINSDALWLDADAPLLEAMAQAFDPTRMDVLLVLIPVTHVDGYTGKGDYALDAVSKHATRRREIKQAAYLFGGIRIINPACLTPYKEEPFSFLQVFDDAEAKGRLFGYLHNGPWFHVGSKEEVEFATARLQEISGNTRDND